MGRHDAVGAVQHRFLPEAVNPSRSTANRSPACAFSHFLKGFERERSQWPSRQCSSGRPGSTNSAHSSCAEFVDLAVGIVIGAAFTGVVNSLVKDILTPILGLLFAGINFTNIFITLKGHSEATLAEAQEAGAVTWNIGLFLNAVFQFLIVSFAIFWLIRAPTRLHMHREVTPPPPKSEVLLEEIRDLLAGRRD